MLLRRVKLPQSLEDMDKFVENFLSKNGFPVNQAYISMTASFIQQSGDGDDSVDTKVLAKRIRRQVANEAAYYLIYPKKRAEYEQAKKEQDESDKAEAAQG